MRLTMIRLFLVIVMGLVFYTCQNSIVQNNQMTSAEIKFTEIPSDSVLLYALSPNIAGLKQVYKARDKGEWETALNYLADYFKETAKTRYYFSWEDFPEKYKQYFEIFPNRLDYHRRHSADMKAMYGSDTQWELPFKNLRGEDVTAYRLRHLSRQSKHKDMVLTYFANPSETENLRYWVEQMADLNVAFGENKYDQGGNAVYEVFRAGKRTHKWLWGHHAYLSAPNYTREDQVESIRTFLHTAAQLAENGKKVRHGNHHTRGMVALFEIASTYPEYAQSSNWLELAITGVTWHLENEINADGFQFERTVHYHKSDIENFFRVWQLAKRGNIQLPEVYATQFKKMFDALLVLAQPDKQLPVLQDDTDAIHAETNKLSDAMAIGTILWQEPAYRYFSSGDVSPLFFWLLNEADLNLLEKGVVEHPTLSSASLEETGYYVMRNGWELDDEYMVITAGLSESKPDHQHADMLGLVAYANGNEILPNYQVKYNKPDFRFWKNSWTKSVMLVDSMTQTQKWKGNSGGSGFGKWLDLPEPRVLASHFGNDIDYFAGTHNGFDGQNLTYLREVLFIKDGFWIVRDAFTNLDKTNHEYQQVWQGLYEELDETTVQRKFDNGSQLLIKSIDRDKGLEWRHGRFATKGNVLRVQSSSQSNFSMNTLILPIAANSENLPGGWKVGQELPISGEFKGIDVGSINWIFTSADELVTFTDHIQTPRGSVEFSIPGIVHLIKQGDAYQITIYTSQTLKYTLTQHDKKGSEGVIAPPRFIINL